MTKLTNSGPVLKYNYDGLQRLVGAVESPGTSYAYTYDAAGNRTSVTVNGTTTTTTYNFANQITNAGYSYDTARHDDVRESIPALKARSSADEN
jgi:YD repeat-containing protein